MEASWRGVDIRGWGSFIFKEKLKNLKEVLKEWNRNNFGNMDERISSLKDNIRCLDERDDEGRLTEVEAAQIREATAQLILQLNNKRSLLA